jgi:hypothetical protein
MKIIWESIEGEEWKGDTFVSDRYSYDVPRTKRAKVLGGWFVFIQEAPQFGTTGAFFYPDPKHQWHGDSLP